MRMCNNDLLDFQVMLADEGEHVLNIVSGIDDHRFARDFVADDRAVALQRADRKDFVNHISIVTSRGQRGPDREQN